MSDASNQEPITVSIVTEIADMENEDPLELAPLDSTLNADALEKLIPADDCESLCVEFQYQGFEVTVEGDGQIDIN